MQNRTASNITPDDKDMMLTQEFGVMKDMLEKAGYKVVVATVLDEPVKGATKTLTPDLKLADVQVGDYAGVMVPCNASGLPSMDPKSLAIVRDTVAAGKPLGAQQSAVVLLSAAGVLDGKQFAMVSGHEWAVPRGIYKGAGVVQDGNIITSGICPYVSGLAKAQDGTTELTQKFIAALCGRPLRSLSRFCCTARLAAPKRRY